MNPLPILHSGVLFELVTRVLHAYGLHANSRPSVHLPGLRQESLCRLPHRGSWTLSRDSLPQLT